MQMLLFIMDAGFGGAVTREMAHGYTSAGPGLVAVARCRGIEKFYWIAGPVIALTAFLIGSMFIVNWNDAASIGREEMLASILMMSAIIGLQWLHGFYTAALYGVYGHMSVAIIQALIWTARTFGALIVLLMAGKTVIHYFLWQLMVAMVGAILLRIAICRRVHQWADGSVPRRMFEALKSVRTIVLTVSGASAVLLVFNQIDKIAVGLNVDLETFGYYMLTWQIAGALYLIYNPIYSIYLPLTVSALSTSDRSLLLARARDGAVLLAILIVPLAMTISVFSPDIIFMWTGDQVASERAGSFLRLTFSGAALHALFFGSYFVQMAAGKTIITLRVASGLLFLMAPAMAISIHLDLGVMAPITVWLLASICFLLISVYLTARDILDVQPLRWLRLTVLTPIGAASVVSAIFIRWLPSSESMPGSILYIVTAWLSATTFFLMVSSDSRRVVREMFQAIFQNE